MQTKKKKEQLEGKLWIYHYIYWMFYNIIFSLSAWNVFCNNLLDDKTYGCSIQRCNTAHLYNFCPLSKELKSNNVNQDII